MKRVAAVVLLLAIACSDAPPAAPVAGGAWRIGSFVYQLQRMDLDALAAAPVDLAIIDYSRHGDARSRFTRAQIAAVQASGKRVLAYLSIGEAEDYRWYWRRAWDRDRDGRPDAGAPRWLGRSNPDWEGNYKVRYWMPGWQRIVYGGEGSYLDAILDAGFDGVYLDIIDAYEYWGDRGRRSAARDMVAFVAGLAAYARARAPGFGVFPQNGEALARFEDYLAVVDGIGREDLWADGDRPQARREIARAMRFLDRFAAAGKAVLVIEYPTRSVGRARFAVRVANAGYVGLATVRDLDRLVL